MATNKKSENKTLLYKYVNDCLNNEYDIRLCSNSLADLYKIASMELKNEHDLSREEHLSLVLPRIPSYMHDKIQAMEVLKADLKEFSKDCDEDFFVNTDMHVKNVLSLFQKDNAEEMKIRNSLYNLQYSIDEELNPHGKHNKFQLLKQMVKNIKQNDGSFDYDPLNASAKRMQYFMKSVPVEERLSLLDSIIRKTKDKNAYNYMSYKAELKKEKSAKEIEERAIDREEKQYRYDDIMQKKLPQAKTNQERIDLCKEALNLVNYKDWGRSKKFQAKIKLYNRLIPIYASEGMEKELDNAKCIRESYEKALDKTRVYSAKKGYGYNR